MSGSSARRALETAIAALPSTVDDEAWTGATIPESTLVAAGLSTQEVATARKQIVAFGEWAKQAISSLPAAPTEEFEATDFNDYYKLVMSRASAPTPSADAVAGAGCRPPICQFQTQLRRRAVFRKGGAASSLGVFDVEPHAERHGCYSSFEERFRSTLQAVGARVFKAETLRALVGSVSAGAAAIEASLGCVTEEWVASLEGKSLFRLLPDGVDFSMSEVSCEAKVVTLDGQVTVLAQGPWHHVTFLETPILQAMSAFMTSIMTSEGDAPQPALAAGAASTDAAVAWCTEAVYNFASAIHQVHDHVVSPAKASVVFFSGRRAPHAEFHLLQHLYMNELWGEASTTSSCFASRVLGGAGRRQRLAGTSAHEGPMAMMALHPELDASAPLSSMLWSLLFFACTDNYTVLPDGLGSATFAQMLAELEVVDEVRLARQDSGLLSRFRRVFPGVPLMASEIENFADIREALAHGYAAIGAGGFFGEKRRAGEYSLAAKITKAMRPVGEGALPPPAGTAPSPTGHVTGYAGKLGDCPSGSWAEAASGASTRMSPKFIVSPEADALAMWQRVLRYATAGDALFDERANGADAAEQARLVSSADAMSLSRVLRHLASSDSLQRHTHIASRLAGYADKVERAAKRLP